MKVWSALDGEPPIQLDVDEVPGQSFIEALASRHREIVGRAIWSDGVMPHRWHYSLRLHARSADDGWLPFGSMVRGPVTTEEVRILLAPLPLEEAERLEVGLEQNRGGDGFFGLIFEAGKVAQDAGGVLQSLLNVAGAAETLRLAGVFRALCRRHHRVPMEAVAAFRRTEVLDDELRWWLRKEYSAHLDALSGLLGLTTQETRSVLGAAGFHPVEPSGVHWVQESDRTQL